MNLKGFLFSALMPMALASCNDILEEVISSDSLRISVADAGSTDKTKAVYSEFTTTFEDGDKIGVYVVKDGQVVKANACFTFDGTAWTTTERVGYNDAYAYYAYYPYVSNPYTPDFTKQNANAIFDSFTKDANNKFHYDDQSTKENFQASDLMIAEGLKKGSNTVSFAMTHRKGLAVFNGDLAMEVTFSGVNKPYTHDSKKYFHMKPETETSFTDDDTGTYSMSAPSGKYETHNINSIPVLEIDATDIFPYTGGTGPLNIISYKQNAAGTIKVKVPWYATFSINGSSTWSNISNFITLSSYSGPGSFTWENYDITVSAQTPTEAPSSHISSVLANATEVSDYDLSLHTVAGTSCSRTTANCYMVHAAGSYKLPLVYGNAIKNGTTNTAAYNPTGTNSETFLKPFVNHAGTGITNPWLKNNGATPDGAKLIWQDVKGMISSVGISGDYLTFTVDKNNIAEGNAVIAATKGGTIVWSWHIWVTPEKLQTLTSIAGTYCTCKVTHVNLGWINYIDKYDSRSCSVKITQDGGKEETFVILQKPFETEPNYKTGANTYYQWGRKDPEIPSATYKTYKSPSTIKDNDRPTYDISGNNTTWELNTSSVTIGTEIQNPLIHYSDPNNHYIHSTKHLNLWNANETEKYNAKAAKTVKTIYDPCPPGYCIPQSGFGRIFLDNTSGTWDSTNLGRLWTNDSPNVFFPATGYRYYGDGCISGIKYKGEYWESNPYGNSCLYIVVQEDTWKNSSENRSHGASIRPVLEE